MFETTYDVRVLENGKLVIKKEGISGKDRLLMFVKEKTRAGRRVIIKANRRFVLETFSNTAYTLKPHTPWVAAPKPVSILYIHHSVTSQLPVNATVEQEKTQMELLDSIAHSRGFNGISYCWACFPSGRCWEGRGFGIVEAATENFNTTSDSIVLVGNYSAFSLSPEQKAALPKLVNRAQRDGFFAKTGLDVRPHRQTSVTSCPGDKVSDEFIAALQKTVNA